MAILNSTADFRTAVSQLQAEDFFGTLIQIAVGDTIVESQVLDDATLTDITPDTATLEAALDRAIVALTADQQIASAQVGLLDKIALAKDNASDIKTLFNAVLDQTINQVAQPTRFNNLYAVVTSASVAFRNRLITDIQEELGFNVAGSLTAAQQRQACLYIRMWITPLAVLLDKA